MKLDQLIQQLQAFREKHGNIYTDADNVRVIYDMNGAKLELTNNNFVGNLPQPPHTPFPPPPFLQHAPHGLMSMNAPSVGRPCPMRSPDSGVPNSRMPQQSSYSSMDS
jgi:hypothetical protein